jgi:aspartyl-tRNA(Asn)/glutamyl-tRNA(Gln) amidotransferase subunit C
MAIDEKVVTKIAHLSRLALQPDEITEAAAKLNATLAWVEQLTAVNVDGIEPLASVNDTSLRTRTDVITDGGKTQDILANAPAKTADFFTVPKVVE